MQVYGPPHGRLTHKLFLLPKAMIRAILVKTAEELSMLMLVLLVCLPQDCHSFVEKALHPRSWWGKKCTSAPFGGPVSSCWL